MKGIIITIGILATFSIWSFSIGWWTWWYPKTYEYNLQLADDASLPQVKADYLKKYLADIDQIHGKPRYIFKRPDLNVETQKEILGGLIQRFEAISQILPSEMAYQQGMYQLTGQEIDNQLIRISDIFKSAKFRENFLLFFIVCFGTWLIPLGFIAWIVFLYREDIF